MNKTKLREIQKKFFAEGWKEFFDALLDDEPVREEIRPKAGEVWQLEGTPVCFVFRRDEQLWMIGEPEGTRWGPIEGKYPEMVHGKNNWHRLYPPVEEK